MLITIHPGLQYRLHNFNIPCRTKWRWETSENAVSAATRVIADGSLFCEYSTCSGLELCASVSSHLSP